MIGISSLLCHEQQTQKEPLFTDRTSWLEAYQINLYNINRLRENTERVQRNTVQTLQQKFQGISIHSLSYREVSLKQPCNYPYSSISQSATPYKTLSHPSPPTPPPAKTRACLSISSHLDLDISKLVLTENMV